MDAMLSARHRTATEIGDTVAAGGTDHGGWSLGILGHHGAVPRYGGITGVVKRGLGVISLVGHFPASLLLSGGCLAMLCSTADDRAEEP